MAQRRRPQLLSIAVAIIGLVMLVFGIAIRDLAISLGGFLFLAVAPGLEYRRSTGR
jgi:hypothetical protein